MTLSVPIISVDVCLVSLLWIVDEALPQEDGIPGRTIEDVFGVICCFSVETGVDALILCFFFDDEADDVNKKPLLKAIFYLVPSLIRLFLLIFLLTTNFVGLRGLCAGKQFASRDVPKLPRPKRA